MSVATTPLQFPLINGSMFSYSSIELNMNGTIFRGFKSIDYSRKRDRPAQYGNSPDPLGKPVGKNSYEATGEIYVAEFRNFVQSLGAGYGDVYFQVTVTYQQNGFDTVQDVIDGCTLDEMSASFTEGTDALSQKFALNPLKILFNMVDDLAVPLISPPQ